MTHPQPRPRWSRTRRALRSTWRFLVHGLAMMGESYMATGFYPPYRPHRSSSSDPRSLPPGSGY